MTDREKVLEAINQHRCSAILRTPLADAVAPAMQAAVEGGFRLVEFTLTTPGALEHIQEFAKNPELVVGAGTVLTVEEAEQAVEAGARFLVSPVCEPRVIGWCKENQIVSIPGTYTATEMMTAHNAGADFVKLFPGPADGPAYVRAILGPLPFLRVFPTSGVTMDNVTDFFAAGAAGVGWVKDLFEPADLQAGRFDQVRERAAKMVKLVQKSPRGS